MAQLLQDLANELAYLAQLKKVYEHFDVPMPLLFPRLSATILDSASARFLAKHELPLEALHARREILTREVLASAITFDLGSSLAGLPPSKDGKEQAKGTYVTTRTPPRDEGEEKRARLRAERAAREAKGAS